MARLPSAKTAILRNASLMGPSALIRGIASSPSVTVTRTMLYRSKAASRSNVSIEKLGTIVDATVCAQQMLHSHVSVKMDI